MRAPRPAVLLVTLALAATPGIAAAQSGGAGDEQYQDPFSGQQGSGGSKGSGGSLGSAPPAASAAPTSTSSSPSATPAAVPALPGELARTGLDLRIVLGAGLVLLIGGLALRRRTDGR